MSSNKVALITGGASGMGLEVATLLSKHGTWTIHILDQHAARGHQAAASLNATFHQCNITNDGDLNTIFNTIYTQSQRLDLVFANAGIAEHANFFEQQDSPDPLLPVKGLHALIDINLKSVITTSYLALHYMRRSPKTADKSLVMTASCGGLYPSYFSPIYTATKHGVVGFMRSIAPYFYTNAGIRVNAICPGTAKTNLMTGEEWERFPEAYFTPVEKIAEVVGMLVEGRDVGGRTVGREGKMDLQVLKGMAVEVSGRCHYYRAQAEFCDDAMRAVMGATDIEVLEKAAEV